MRHRLRLLAPAIAALWCCLLPAPAGAGFTAPVTVDGPSADILSVSDLDVARDGQGAVTYLRRDGGVTHAYLSRFTGGQFSAPQRLDGGTDAPGAQPVVAAADGGRLAAAFVSGSVLYATVFNPSTGQWSPAQVIADPASNPSLDLSIHGAGFLTYTSGGDVRAARLERTATQFTPIAAALDLDPARIAGEGAGRSRVAIGADSTAIAVWGEEGRVVARRLYRTSISTAPADLTLGDLEGRPGGEADLPEVAIEDDSSFVQVAFRQRFADGGAAQARTVARRLRGSAIDPPAIVDGTGWGGPDALRVDVDLNGKGAGGTTTVLADGSVVAAILKDDKFAPGAVIGGSAGTQAPAQLATAETTQRVAAWIGGDGIVRGRFYDDRADTRTLPVPGPEAALSSADWGAADPAAGLLAGADRVGDALAVFVQGTGDGRRLVAGSYDRPPISFSLYTSTAWRSPLTAPLTWAPANDLWGGVTYVVSIDGREVGRTTQTSFTIPPEALVKDGIRSWRVTAVDQRGQQITADSRILRLDSLGPQVAVAVVSGKTRLVASARASDVIPPGQRASGVATVSVSTGAGAAAVPGRTVAIPRGPRKRKVTIIARATDKAGNTTIVRRTVTVPKRKRGG